MGSGGSKKLEPRLAERRRSHIDTNPPPQSEVLVKCNCCGRTFAEDRINRHVEVCEKMQERKRDVFNTAERRGGTLLTDDDEDDRKRPDWKQTRTDLLGQLKELKRARPKSGINDPPIELYAPKGPHDDVFD